MELEALVPCGGRHSAGAAAANIDIAAIEDKPDLHVVSLHTRASDLHDAQGLSPRALELKDVVGEVASQLAFQRFHGQRLCTSATGVQRRLPLQPEFRQPGHLLLHVRTAAQASAASAPDAQTAEATKKEGGESEHADRHHQRPASLLFGDHLLTMQKQCLLGHGLLGDHFLAMQKQRLLRSDLASPDTGDEVRRRIPLLLQLPCQALLLVPFCLNLACQVFRIQRSCSQGPG
mmetsp:Transcript_96310/g.206723  ORF Transcript_96310/g.206723 Transcript_96310/m.206723 type:complete len:233 (+) Transcript_96310:396-1094(+)